MKVSILTLIIIVSLTFEFSYKKTGRFKVTNDLNMIVSQEGFLSCGETIRITKTEFIIFDKELYSESNLCLKGIDMVETIRIDENGAEFLIYHNKELDSEYPYQYEIENQNMW